MKKNKEKKMYIATILLTIILLAFIFVQNFISFYRNAVSEADALGRSCLTSETKQLEAYINKGMNALKVVSDTVEYMVSQGAEASVIEKYLVNESSACRKDIDENCTGIYGLINGKYVDGVGWVPDKDYVPEEREWYKLAADAGGEVVIVPPYVDAQTGNVIISLSKMLGGAGGDRNPTADKKNVLSFDIILNNVQSITEKINLDDKGYGFIVTDSGLVIAHFDKTQKGRNYLEDSEKKDLTKKILSEKNGSFTYMVDGKRSTVFTDTIYGDWHVVMVISDAKLLDGFISVLIRSIIISVFIAALVIFFYMRTFRKMNTLLVREEEHTNEIEELNGNIVKALAHTIDAKDRYTRGHSQRVAEYSLEIAKRMGKSEEEQRIIYYVGLLHDVGKIRVPEDVINKPGRLTDEEFDQIKLHPVASYHILKDIYKDKTIADSAKFHHERYDGGGYPNGLKEENIPEVARIIGVADAYDAMASNRSYRDALPQEVVRAEIEKGKGKQFDPGVADIMLGMIDEDKEYNMCEKESANKNILVVDDDEIIQKTVVTFTKKIPNYKIICASSGGEAVKIVEENHIDLMLLDIKMPEMNGFETMEKIRAISDVPVIFMTGDKNAEMIADITAAGASDYIMKPFMPNILKEVIYSVLSER